MHYILFKIGNLPIYSYGFMIAIGIIAAIFVTMYRAPKKGLDKEVIPDIAIFGVIGGILGAKLLFIIAEMPRVLKDPLFIIETFSSGFVIYGGLIGGAFLAYLYCRKKGVSFIKYFDLVAPSISIAQGFGRIGCLLAGCCYGRESNCSIGITFHDSPFAPNDVSLLPTQIISSLGNFLIALIVIKFASKPRKDGQVAGLYIILYSIGRFIIEFFRGDPRGNVGILSTSQFIAIFTLTAGIALFNLRRIKKIQEND